MQAKITKFIRLLIEKKEISKEAKLNQEAIDVLEPEIRNHFADNSIEKLTQNGLTIFVKRQIFAQKREVDDIPVSNEACIEALRQADLGMYFEEKIKSQALNSYFKELVEEGAEIPKPLQSVFRPIEVFKMGSRKS